MQLRPRSPRAGGIRAFLREPSRLSSLQPVVPPTGGEDEPATPSLDGLKQAIRRIEGRIAPAHPASGHNGGKDRLVLGVPAFDSLFADGAMPLHALTELRSAESRSGGAMSGFLVALMVMLSARRPGPLLWVRESRIGYELGQPAALGLLHLGLDPGRLLLVEVARAADVLGAIEDGLGSGALGAVIGEMQDSPKVLDLTASRRLALRARDHAVPALLLSHGSAPQSSAATTRLRIESRPSRPLDGFADGPGYPAWRVTVEKNREGRPGHADMEWNADDRSFAALEPLDGDLSAPPADRPAGPPALGEVVAYRRPAGR